MQFVLDVNKWICGSPIKSPSKGNFLGEGITQLINKQGYMCCVGQFALQCGVRSEDLKLISGIPFTSRENRYRKLIVNLEQDTLRDLYAINDDKQILIENKIRYISKILKDSGHTLKVILPNQETLKRITFPFLVPIMFITT